MSKIPEISASVTDKPLVNIFDIVVPSPAAGDEWSYVVPINQQIRILSLHFRLVTDANVAARGVAISFRSPQGVLFESGHNTAISDGQDWRFNIAPGVGFSEGSTVSPRKIITMPYELDLTEGCSISSDTLALQVGDQYSEILIRSLFQFLRG